MVSLLFSYEIDHQMFESSDVTKTNGNVNLSFLFEQRQTRWIIYELLLFKDWKVTISEIRKSVIKNDTKVSVLNLYLKIDLN